MQERKGNISLLSVQKKYNEVYFIPEKVDGVLFLMKQKYQVHQFMQLMVLVTKLR
jgi:hypothetical protein